MPKAGLYIGVAIVIIIVAIVAGLVAMQQPAQAPAQEQTAAETTPVQETPARTPSPSPSPQPTPEQEVIKIGYLGPATKPYGDIAVKSIQLAIDEINAKGGVLGKKVELVVFDDENKPDVATTGFRKLVYEDNVVAIFGIHSSAVGLALLPLIKEAKVPVFAHGSVADQIDEQVAQDPGLKYWFRFNINASTHALIVYYPAKYIAEKYGFNKVGILYDKHAWTAAVVKKVKEVIQRDGFELVFEGTIEPGKTTSFVPHLTKARDAGVQILMVWTAYGDGKVLQRDYNELKPPFVLVQFDVVGMTLKQWDITGGSLPYQIFVFYNFPATEATQRFVSSYEAKYGELGFFYPPFFMYDAVNAWKEAVEAVGSFDGDKVADYLARNGYMGITGRWIFTEGHTPLFGPEYLATIAVQWTPEGETRVVWPPDVAEGEVALPPWVKG